MTEESVPLLGARKKARELIADKADLGAQLTQALADLSAAQEAVRQANVMANASAEAAQRRADQSISEARLEADRRVAEAKERAEDAERRLEAAEERVARARTYVTQTGEISAGLNQKLQQATEFIRRFDVGDQVRMNAALEAAGAELARRREEAESIVPTAQLAAAGIIARAEEQAQEVAAAARQEMSTLDARVAEVKARTQREVEAMHAAAEAEVAALREAAARDIGADRALLETEQADLSTSILEHRRNEALARAEVQNIEAAVAAARLTLADVISQVQAAVKDTPDVWLYSEYGLYAFEHPAASAADLSALLATNRERQQKLLDDGRAVVAASGFAPGGSVEDGAALISRLTPVALRAYNAEAENIIRTVDKDGLAAGVKRLVKAKNDIAELGVVAIAPEFHKLRIQELELAVRHLTAVAAGPRMSES
jgi:hypothetical protein